MVLEQSVIKPKFVYHTDKGFLQSLVYFRITSYSSSLKELDLSANKLTCIPIELADLERLTYLNLG